MSPRFVRGWSRRAGVVGAVPPQRTPSAATVGDDAFFQGFRLEFIDTGDTKLRVRSGGNGNPVVLLHGHPRTHTTWHRVAPRLAEDFFVVCPDLRGYGQSSKVRSTPDHQAYSKRAMADDIVALMHSMGHERFAVVGHDRGAHVAQRMALDHPASVSALAVLGAIPIGEVLARANATVAEAWWHWFFLGQTATPAEQLINLDPDAWYRSTAAQMGVDNHIDYRRAVNDPGTVHAMCEDHRAGLTVDRANDDVDRAAGRLIDCQTLVLWALDDDLVELFGDPLAIWRAWARNMSGFAIGGGHHMPEDNPVALTQALAGFLRAI